MSVVRFLVPYLHWGAILFFALATAALVIGFLYFRRARLAPFYILREAARRRGVIWSVAAAALVLVGGLGLLLQALVPAYDATPSPQRPATATPSPASLPTIALIVMPTATPAPPPTATPTPTRRPTATPPLIATPAPSVPLPEDAVARLPDAVPAPDEAGITFVAFALQESSGAPVDPGTEFPPGDHRVYFFFDYQEMESGVTWTYRWCQDGVCGDGLTCSWGIPAGECPWVSTTSGTTHLFFKPINGYEPGLYEVRVWIEDRIQVVESFVIRETP